MAKICTTTDVKLRVFAVFSNDGDVPIESFSVNPVDPTDTYSAYYTRNPRFANIFQIGIRGARTGIVLIEIFCFNNSPSCGAVGQAPVSISFIGGETTCECDPTDQTITCTGLEGDICCISKAFIQSQCDKLRL